MKLARENQTGHGPIQTSHFKLSGGDGAYIQ
jgi:hypothetical protein